MDGGFSLEDTDLHFWLTRSVARVAGVNLGRALSSGALSPDDYAMMVARCQANGCQVACKHWLGQQTDWPAQPPSYCAHSEVLRDLRQKQSPH